MGSAMLVYKNCQQMFLIIYLRIVLAFITEEIFVFYPVRDGKNNWGGVIFIFRVFTRKTFKGVEMGCWSVI